MTQTRPRYEYMTSSVNKLITEPLVRKYGLLNVVSPIVIITNNSITFYIYETTKISSINKIDSNKPVSLSGIPSHFTDYASTPRSISPPSRI
jgi:hypothetical protein